MAIYQSVEGLVGRTPLVRLGRFTANRGLRAQILGKLESRNPGGSVKDRVALEMLRQAEEDGLLSPGGTILEPPPATPASALPPSAQPEAIGSSSSCQRL